MFKLYTFGVHFRDGEDMKRFATLCLVFMFCYKVDASISDFNVRGKVYSWTKTDFDYPSVDNRLTGHVIREQPKVHTLTHCAFHCYRTPGCLSYNFNLALKVCELNNATEESRPADLGPADGYVYVRKDGFIIDEEALGPCISEPCSNSGRCMTRRTLEGNLAAYCICDDEWTGQYCTEPAGSLDWDLWQEWGECSTSCDAGWQTRRRDCVNEEGQIFDALDCYGADEEHRACPGLLPCPRWDSWSAWDECSAATTCGSGVKTRMRTCLFNGTPGEDRLCMGAINETTPCVVPSCTGIIKLEGGSTIGEGNVLAYDDVTTEWGAVCADGWDEREVDIACRHLGFAGNSDSDVDPSSISTLHDGLPFTLTGLECQGSERHIFACAHEPWMNEQASCTSGVAMAQCKVNGDWNTWSQWGDCSVSCADGIQIRTRPCDYPPALRGGRDCIGEPEEIRPCTLDPCPEDGSRWGPWDDWSGCSVSCGSGVSIRRRQCVSDVACEGDSVQTHPCVMRSCDAQTWSSWSPWSRCSVSCGGGTAMRSRRCLDPDQSKCLGHDREFTPCTMQECQGIVWRPWSTWSSCDASCNGGTLQRMRQRNCGVAEGLCHVTAQVQAESCNVEPCSVDGYWLPWTDWLPCNVTCGGGGQMRTRNCNDAQHGGASCSGDTVSWQQCNIHNCPIDCEWSTWSAWATCNTTCGGGFQQRTRHEIGPFYGGSECVGPADDWQECNTHNCPIDCVWEEWLAWQPCNVSCGGGQQVRMREVNGPFFGGADCEGPFDNWRECNIHECPIDCVWSEWANWAACNATCGTGWQSRIRDEIGPFYGGADCVGPQDDWQMCNTHECPVDCIWHEWQSWAACNVSCGGGQQVRIRDKEGPFHLGAECQGPEDDWQACNEHHCPIDGYWAAWSAWGDCSVSCENGTQQRNRSCVQPMYGGEDCVGDDTEIQDCFLVWCPVDGVWEEWGDWASCSELCGTGQQHRSRQCRDPLYNGAPCEGERNQTQLCNVFPCPESGFWLNWAPWGECSISCGGGKTTRTRDCVPPRHGGENCTGPATAEMDCNTFECPIDCEWDEWSMWQECNRTCGGGYQVRHRGSEGPFHDGKPCEGEGEEWQMCNPESCAIHCVWFEWSAWSDCNQTCGFGSQLRTRGKDGPYFDGDPCPGSNEDWRGCNSFECPIDCVWNDWAEWGPCNKTCGVGHQLRERTVDGPYFGGEECIGSTDDWRTCNEHDCPVNCIWHSWLEWQTCDVSCGGGTQVRERLSEGPHHDGLPCVGPAEEWQDCNMHNCPIDCVWEEWLSWQPCNVSCGGGQQVRLREVDGPFFGGAECVGPSDDWQECNIHECPIDCVWLEWSAWAACNTTCGGGYQQRVREVDGPHFGGAECVGSTDDWQECNTHNCPINCVWNDWGAWQECSLTCGNGTQLRDRTVDGPYYGGAECEGPTQDSQECNTFECPIDCMWLAWEPWQPCPVSCGGDERKRFRPHEGPFFGGDQCIGSAEDFEPCNTQNCPIDGYWLAWSSWSECSLTCGGGEALRNRTCNEPLYGGAPCPGSDTDTMSCNEQPCPIPGDFHEWNTWSLCTATCGGGTRMRTRECDMESYGDLTAPCEGINVTSEACHEFDCLPMAVTCSEYVERGLVDNTWVEVDPDGTYGRDAFFVFCQSSGENQGVTMLHHQYENTTTVEGYEGAGEYMAILQYTDQLGNVIDTEQIMALVDASESCRQYISWNCSSAIFNPDEATLQEENRAPYKLTYWHNRWEEAMNYWGGAEPDMNRPRMTCACGMDGSCANPAHLCNCDSNDEGNWRQDEGWLTFKYDLPVTSFHAGDTGEKGEEGHFMVGPLSCQGIAEDDYFW